MTKKKNRAVRSGTSATSPRGASATSPAGGAQTGHSPAPSIDEGIRKGEKRRRLQEPEKCHRCHGDFVIECPSCNGEGGEGADECSECHASEDNGRYADVPCPECTEEGKVEEGR